MTMRASREDASDIGSGGPISRRPPRPSRSLRRSAPQSSYKGPDLKFRRIRTVIVMEERAEMRRNSGVDRDDGRASMEEGSTARGERKENVPLLMIACTTQFRFCHQGLLPREGVT